MDPDNDDQEEETRDPGASALLLIGVIAILVIVGFLYTVMTG